MLIILKYKLVYIFYKSKYKLAIIYKYNKTNFINYNICFIKYNKTNLHIIYIYLQNNIYNFKISNLEDNNICFMYFFSFSMYI